MPSDQRLKILRHPSDRGSLSTAVPLGMIASMSWADNCYDNAPIESFWGTLKNELIHPHGWPLEHTHSRPESIEIFYNRQRIQARRHYLSLAATICNPP